MFKKIFAIVVILVASNSSHAGIPVIDAANLTQAIQQVIAWSQQADQMTQQYSQLQSTFSSMTGNRGFASISNNPMLQNVIPADVSSTLNQVTSLGNSGLSNSALTTRLANTIYDCSVKTGSDRTTCESNLGMVYQNQSMQQNALSTLNQRMSQIDSLRDAINSTNDPKSIGELQARLQAETAQVNNDANRIQLMQQMQQNQQDQMAQKQHEQFIQMLSKKTLAVDSMPAF